MYTYIHVCEYLSLSIYIYIYREREIFTFRSGPVQDARQVLLDLEGADAHLQQGAIIIIITTTTTATNTIIIITTNIIITTANIIILDDMFAIHIDISIITNIIIATTRCGGLKRPRPFFMYGFCYHFNNLRFNKSQVNSIFSSCMV